MVSEFLTKIINVISLRHTKSKKQILKNGLALLPEQLHILN